MHESTAAIYRARWLQWLPLIFAATLLILLLLRYGFYYEPTVIQNELRSLQVDWSAEQAAKVESCAQGES